MPARLHSGVPSAVAGAAARRPNASAPAESGSFQQDIAVTAEVECADSDAVVDENIVIRSAIESQSRDIAEVGEDVVIRTTVERQRADSSRSRQQDIVIAIEAQVGDRGAVVQGDGGAAVVVGDHGVGFDDGFE